MRLGGQTCPQGTHGLEAERPLLVTLQLPIPALVCGHESKPSWRPVCLRRPWGGGAGYSLCFYQHLSSTGSVYPSPPEATEVGVPA